MKNLKKALLCAVAITFTAAPAMAQDDDFYFKPYAGIELQHTVVDFASSEGIDFDDVYENNFNGGALYLGARVHKNLGLELGYSRTKEESKNDVLGTGINTKLQLQSLTFDVLGYCPVEQVENLELIGSVGLARTKAKASIDAKAIGFSSARGDETETKLRLGLGAQYQVAEDLNFRGMLRWQDADFDDSAKNAYVLGLGLNYSF